MRRVTGHINGIGRMKVSADYPLDQNSRKLGVFGRKLGPFPILLSFSRYQGEMKQKYSNSVFSTDLNWY